MNNKAWPALPYNDFKSTAYLLHRAVQVFGKLKLHTPFEPHWSNVVLWITARGITTGLIPFRSGGFSLDIDLIDHEVSCVTSWDGIKKFGLRDMSVAELTELVFVCLHQLQIDITINPKPQEVENPIEFSKDTQQQTYDKALANAWWRILVNTQRIMQRYHARFDGETPGIGLMWGTFDIRDARYNGVMVPTTGINSSYIRRNAMNEAQIEAGWFVGNEAYPRPAFYSFTYPQPEKIEQAGIKPSAAKWDTTLNEFILDYDDLRKAKDPDNDLLAFFESTYEAGATLAGWPKKLVTSGEPA